MKRLVIAFACLVLLFVPAIGMYCSASQPPSATNIFPPNATWRTVEMLVSVYGQPDKETAHRAYRGNTELAKRTMSPTCNSYLQHWNGHKWVTVEKFEKVQMP